VSKYWTTRTNDLFPREVQFSNIISHKLRSETSVDMLEYSHMDMAVLGSVSIYSLGLLLLLFSHLDTLYIASNRRSPQLI
jgi:hypothetical protein